MAGQQKSVYLEDEDVERVEAHARRNARSFSWALRDLLRVGWRELNLSTEEDFQRLWNR